MRITLYPTLEEALMLHDILIARYGGASGVRDKGALEAALFRPQTGYYDSLALEAAALLQSLSLNEWISDYRWPSGSRKIHAQRRHSIPRRY